MCTSSGCDAGGRNAAVRMAANNTARERMAAIKFIEDKAEKSLTLAGVIQRVSIEALQDDGQTKKKLTAEGLQLIKDGAARTLSTLELLEAGSQTRDMIDVDPVEESNELATGTNVQTDSRGGPPALNRLQHPTGVG